MNKLFSKSSLCMIGTSLALLSGCAINMPVPVKDITPSADKYTKAEAAAPASLYFVDAQTAENKAKLVTGRIPMNPTYQGKPLDAVSWLSRNTVAELAGRGLPVKLANEAAGANTVQVKFLHIENRRISGFSPFETFTSLNADLVTAKGQQRIAFWVKRGKVPVWSFDEVIDPTFNVPLALMSKELAARINQYMYGQSISDAQVDALVKKIEGAGKEINALDVYELGFGNNPRAVASLVKWVKAEDGDVARAATSALGILNANDKLPVLVELYEKSKSDVEDRATAFKAICDLNGAEAKAYVAKQGSALAGKDDREAATFKAIMALYK